MSKRYFLFLFALCIFSFNAVSQNKEAVEVYDFDSEPEILKTRSSALDKTHPNLLNPQIAKEEHETVTKSWTKLHRDIAQFLEANDFEWETEESQIMILHKFYFEPNGEIHTYAFKMMNEEINESQRRAYSDLMTKFAETYRIDIIKDGQFAQCGKTKYLN
ncbi:hypothetical protein NE848_04745 [Gramella jeungdoensis]|uniref:Uncharacterized protein n=1 Tax=Gramella jeungdoensis TaxID=708091 RepID=A0ABT0YZA7_9FLAO|nr:hypothetical protein [Gramella jeungdoensis]MCM8568674.1 hypothetical protein [Gramella jeungdoensis]